MSELQFFCPDQDFTVTWQSLPHWAQAGTVCFITWRTADSLPAQAIKRIGEERERLLLDQGIDPHGDWKSALASRPCIVRGRVQWALFELWDHCLDLGQGACVLRNPDLSAVVGESLQHFDGERYLVTDYVVMPNHVHLLVAFHDEAAMATQCTSWKRYTARRINQLLGQTGEFWQVEKFDHLVRSPEQFVHYRQYIADNPRRAQLPTQTYRHYSKLAMRVG